MTLWLMENGHLRTFDGRYTFNSTLVNSLNLSLNIQLLKLMDAVTVDAFKEEMTDKLKLTSEVQNFNNSSRFC